MDVSIPNSGLILLVHPFEISGSCVQKHICSIKSWYLNIVLMQMYLLFRQYVVELDYHDITQIDTNMLDLQQASVAFFDLTSLIYHHNFSKSSVLTLLRKIESAIQKQKIPVFASLRNNLLCNEYLYLIQKAVIFSDIETSVSPEERFSESPNVLSVSILSRPGSGKLEIDDRFEFCISNGFTYKKLNPTSVVLGSACPVSTFNLDRKPTGENTANSEAKILVEDSDRDSEDEMEADSNF